MDNILSNMFVEVSFQIQFQALDSRPGNGSLMLCTVHYTLSYNPDYKNLIHVVAVPQNEPIEGFSGIICSDMQQFNGVTDISLLFDQVPKSFRYWSPNLFEGNKFHQDLKDVLCDYFMHYEKKESNVKWEKLKRLFPYSANITPIKCCLSYNEKLFSL